MGKKFMKESLEKIKFYDRLLGISLIGTIIGIILLMFFTLVVVIQNEYILAIVYIIFMFVGFITLAIFSWGMVYHKFKNKKYLWLSIDLVLLILTLLGFVFGVQISSIIFYFVFMRKQFKKGKR